MNSFFRQAGHSAIAHFLAVALGVLSCALDALAGGGTGNIPPSVGIALPAGGTTFRAPVNITLVALAYDSDGTVTQVQFFNGTTPIGSPVTASPWQITWTNVPPGTYSITAKATDNATTPATTTSSPITITVLPTSTQPPQAMLTAPLNCVVIDEPGQIVFKADAYADNGIQLVEFLANGQVKGSTTVAPYQFTWNSVMHGTYQLAVRATDKTGLVTTSPSITATVNGAPTVTLTSPSAGTFSSPYNMQFAATATDDVHVAKVEFIANNQVQATITSPPYQYTWNNVPPGTYQVWAKAYDDRNLAAYSQFPTVTVTANQAPTVRITAPTANQSFDSPANITLTASASDPDGTIAQVQFKEGSTVLGNGTLASPGVFTLAWSNGPGTYTFTAVATDNANAQTTSAPVTITVAVHTGTGETIVFLHNDIAGNAIAATDTTGAVLWKENYRPFGDRLVNAAASASNRQWFAGKAADTETGLSYFGARYYDSTVGRFMSVDPKGLNEQDLHSFNRFAYGNNNPYKYVDLDGRIGIDIIFVAIDIYAIATEGPTTVNLIATGLDIASTFGVGFGAGQIFKGAVAAERASEIYRGSQLARNMAEAGNGVIKGAEEAHHIVAQNAKAAEPARKILAEHGIDIHGAENGAAMAKDAHRGLHTNEYYNTLNNRLQQANQGENAGRNVREVLKDYRNKLEAPQ